MNSSHIHKITSVIKDVETLSTGDTKKIIKRGKNKIKAKLLHKCLNKIGYWSR